MAHRSATARHRPHLVSPRPQVGDRFVLNCLGQGTFEPLMKHFLKRFAAGADRFEVRAAAWAAALFLCFYGWLRPVAPA